MTPLLTLQEAALIARLKEMALRRAIDRGELPAFKLCSRVRIERAELDAWMARNRVGGLEPQPRP